MTERRTERAARVCRDLPPRVRCARASGRACVQAIVVLVSLLTVSPPTLALSQTRDRVGVGLAPDEARTRDRMSRSVWTLGPSAPGFDRRLLTPRDVRLAELFVLATALAAPFDSRMAGEAQAINARSSAPVRRTADVVRVMGDPGALVLSAGTYAAGRLTHQPGLADAGLHATEAVIVSGAASAVIKVLAGRARPFAVSDRDADEFRVGRGWGANTAFPSGHTTVAFAAASAASTEIGRSAFALRHPAAARVAGPLLYASAALVGASRVYHDKHWASDVVAGAAVGTLVGRALVRYQHAAPRGRLERWLLPSSVAPFGTGATLGWSASFR